MYICLSNQFFFIVHIRPEYVVHLRTECIVHFCPESIVHFHQNIHEQPTLLERKKTGDRILKKILNFVDTFINGITG